MKQWLGILLIFVAAPALASDDAAAGNPLAPFTRLVGGTWQTEGSYQEFEWGLGQQSLVVRSYFVQDGQSKLVSEGAWVWHPGKQQIKGSFTAIEMPVVFFDYTTRFEGNTMISELASYTAKGEELSYRETWEFTDDDQYVWTLYRITPEGPKREMGATYSRKP